MTVRPGLFKGFLIGLPRPAKQGVALGADTFCCLFAAWFALSLRLERPVGFLQGDGALLALPALIALSIAIPIFISFGLYRAIFRYSGWNAMNAVIMAGALYGVLYFTLVSVVGVGDVPRSVGLSQPLLFVASVAVNRTIVRFWLGGLYMERREAQQSRPILVYGAGEAGKRLAAIVPSSRRYRVAGFLDDARDLQGTSLDGQRIHSPQHLGALIEHEKIQEVWLAMPALDASRRAQIIDSLRPFGLRVRTLPRIHEMLDDNLTLKSVRDLDVLDLLSRDPVKPDEGLLEIAIRDKVVLVTGAGGSIGGEICRQALRRAPRLIVLYEQSEVALYGIERALRTLMERMPAGTTPPRVIPVLGSVNDRSRLDAVFARWKPDVVYHAAAYKHVPIVEHNPGEGLKTNVWGTLHCAEAAVGSGAAIFVLVSTDKAVRPTNVMGASKRLAEMVVQSLARESHRTRLAIVRFGNVLDSSGSVVPLFREQISMGGPVTVTHPEATRFFMSIPEAAQLVMQAGAMAQGGEVFLLEMGHPVRILDLAQRMIALSGRQHDIDIEFVGLRPGEKLYEELLIGDDAEPSAHPGIMRAHEPVPTAKELSEALSELDRLLQRGDEAGERVLLKRWVTGYQPSEAEVIPFPGASAR